MRRRSIIAACILLFLVLVLAALWTGFDWPPPGLILRYGFPPTGGPTGRRMTIEGVEFVELKPGYFRMGSHFLCEEGDLLGRICARLGLLWGDSPKQNSNECPPHWVDISRGFWIARTEVTNHQYEHYAPRHRRRSSAPGDHDPLTGVTWEQAREYCSWLSRRGGLTARLPSESEWEYACRAGSAAEYSFGDDEDRLPYYARFLGNSGFGAGAVGQSLANRWGLHDFHGSVSEWVEDSWHEDYHGAPADERAWNDPTSLYRVVRGATWLSESARCRSAYRDWLEPDNLGEYIGVRPAASTKGCESEGMTVGAMHSTQVD